MKVLIRNRKQFAQHNKTMEAKFIGVPFNVSTQTPENYPCIVISWAQTGVNGYSICHEFVYCNDFAAVAEIRD